MKAPVRKTRHKLIIEDSDPELFIGLVTAEADYKVSLLINKKLGINFRNNDPVIKTVNENDVSFSRFTSDSRYTDIVYDLISNDSGKEKLITKIPSLDYLLRIKGTNDSVTIDTIIRKIRTIGEITGVFVLDKNRQIETAVLQIIP